MTTTSISGANLVIEGAEVVVRMVNEDMTLGPEFPVNLLTVSGKTQNKLKTDLVTLEEPGNYIVEYRRNDFSPRAQVRVVRP